MWKALSLIAATEVGARLKNRIIAFVIFVIAGVIFVISLCFFLFSLYIWLARSMSDLEASMTISGSLFLLAVIFSTIGYFIKNRQLKTSPLTSTALIAAPVAAGIISKFPRASIVGFIAVIAAGFFLAKKNQD
jgi:hypothetical protein